jgi:hypothetical protein
MNENEQQVKNINELIEQSDPLDKIGLSIHFRELGKYLNRLYRYEEAECAYQKSLDLNESHNARYHIALTQLHQGKIIDGFKNNKSRWYSSDIDGIRNQLEKQGIPHVFEWKDIINKRVFVVSEQGAGDEIFYSRVLSEAIPFTSKIGYSSYHELFALFNHNFPEVEFIGLDQYYENGIPEIYDCIMSVVDLFAAYAIEFGHVPPMKKYVSIFDNTPVVPNSIGYTWSAGDLSDNSMARTIPEASISCLGSSHKIYNFQMNRTHSIGVDVTSGIRDYMDTAILLDGIENVITCDTSFVHLSLMMGKPTILLIKDYLDWRFKIGMYPLCKILSINETDFKNKLMKILTD